MTHPFPFALSRTAQPVVARRRLLMQALAVGGTLLSAQAVRKHSRAATTNAAEAPASLSSIAQHMPMAAPDITFADGTGATSTLSRWRGRPVVLHLWATWCGPCVTELPQLARLAAALTPSDPAIVVVSVDRGGAPVVKRFLDAHHISGLQTFYDPDHHAMTALAIEELPSTVVFDAQGQEIARHGGPLAWGAPDALKTLRELVS